MTKQPKKLGRGLSALMAEITPPAPAPAKPKPKSKSSVKKTLTKSKVKKVSAQKPASKKTTAKKPAAPKPRSPGRGVNNIPISYIERNPDQPRRVFDQALLEELTASIKDKGVLQPILLRPLPNRLAKKKKVSDSYQIVAGERRWQAALNAGLDQMPALIRELSDQEVLEIGVVENVQRADLNPIEEAMAYQALKDQFGRRQEDIAKAIGKSRSHVANCLRLLTLPVLAREYLSEGKISAGHARAILSAPDPQALAEAIVDKGMSVREAEAWARSAQKAKRDAKSPKENKKSDADSRFIEKQLSDHLGLRVNLKHKNPGGSLSIKYKTLDQLDDLIKRMRKM